MKKWLVSFVGDGKFLSSWIEFHGEEVNVEMLHEDLSKRYNDICIISILPSKLSDKQSIILQKEKKTVDKTPKNKKKVVPELGQNRVKISGPLPEDLKHLIGLEGDVIGQENNCVVVLTAAGLYPNVPLQNVTKI